MSSTLPNVVSPSTEADDQSPQVEPSLVVAVVIDGSKIDLNFYNDNTVVVDGSLNSMISSGSRALGGYSLSLLSNSNLAQSDVGSPHQAPP